MNDVAKDALIERLRNGAATVTFIKVNGEKRIMDCTLSPELIPQPLVEKIVEPVDASTEKPERKKNPNVVSVWDINAAGWRSFKWDSITDFS